MQTKHTRAWNSINTKTARYSEKLFCKLAYDPEDYGVGQSQEDWCGNVIVVALCED